MPDRLVVAVSAAFVGLVAARRWRKLTSAADAPADANQGCVGPSSNQAGKVSGCAGCPNQQKCASGKGAEPDPGVAEVARKLAGVKRKILVLSGKGGVGKSTVSAQLSFALAEELEVGLLDVDICGPSIPRMLGLMGHEVHQSSLGWDPVYIDRLAVMSIGFMLPRDDDAVIWRGPKKHGLVKQYLTDVVWGELDALVVDTPPGTSDEHLSLVGQLKDSGIDGAVLVTTPQEVSLQDVRKEVSFCKKLNVPIIGVIENMAGLTCPHCRGHIDVFQPSSGGAQAMCDRLGLKLLGSLPMDTTVALAGDQGKPLAQQSAASPVFKNIVQQIRAQLQI